MNDWEVRLHFPAESYSVSIYMIMELENRIRYAYLDEDGSTMVHEVDLGKEIKPYISLPLSLWKPIKEKILEESREDQDFATATRYHLEDMRRLVYKEL